MKLKALLLATALALASAPAIAADPNGGLAVTTGSGTTLCAFTGTGSFTQVYTCTIPVYQNGSGVGVPVSTTNGLPTQGTGVAGTPAGGVQTVQGAASMTPILDSPQLPAGSTYQAGSAAAVSTTGAQTMVATPGSGHALFGSVLSCGNSSATGTFVTFNDAHTLQIYVPPTYGNNIIMPLPSTIQWASNTAATFATVTSVNEVICNFVGYSI